MQENASHVILLPPLSTGQVRPAVMRCAKQRDCAPVHILPYLSSRVYIFLEVIFIICKCVLLFLVKNRSIDIKPFAPIGVSIKN